MEKFYSLEEVAELLGVNYQLIYRLVRAGDLPALKIGRIYRVTQAGLDEYLQAQNTQAAHRCAAMLHLANITIRVRRKIKYDPVKEEIIGDLEANRFVNPPTRAPWHL